MTNSASHGQGHNIINTPDHLNINYFENEVDDLIITKDLSLFDNARLITVMIGNSDVHGSGNSTATIDLDIDDVHQLQLFLKRWLDSQH